MNPFAGHPVLGRSIVETGSAFELNAGLRALVGVPSVQHFSSGSPMVPPTEAEAFLVANCINSSQLQLGWLARTHAGRLISRLSHVSFREDDTPTSARARLASAVAALSLTRDEDSGRRVGALFGLLYAGGDLAPLDRVRASLVLLRAAGLPPATSSLHEKRLEALIVDGGAPATMLAALAQCGTIPEAMPVRVVNTFIQLRKNAYHARLSAPPRGGEHLFCKSMVGFPHDAIEQEWSEGCLLPGASNPLLAVMSAAAASQLNEPTTLQLRLEESAGGVIRIRTEAGGPIGVYTTLSASAPAPEAGSGTPRPSAARP